MPFHRAVYAALLILLLPLLAPPALAAVPVTLSGSPGSMSRQHDVARSAGYAFAGSSAEMRALVGEGTLVPLPGNADYRINDGVSGPYARPEMRLFIERLAEQYRAATGERLVVTSLTRPQSHQPRNSHALSVHPTGMAVDLRVSSRSASRRWLESTLLALEKRGVLDVTRERRPPHYHVALFPEQYAAYVDGLIGPEALATALRWDRTPSRDERAPSAEPSASGRTSVAVTNAQPTQPRSGDGPDWLKLLVVLPAAALIADAVRRRRGRAGASIDAL